eukprot:Nk52_evm11s224 gene=Nk52_evmTU11s224
MASETDSFPVFDWAAFDKEVVEIKNSELPRAAALSIEPHVVSFSRPSYEKANENLQEIYLSRSRQKKNQSKSKLLAILSSDTKECREILNIITDEHVSERKRLLVLPKKDITVDLTKVEDPEQVKREIEINLGPSIVYCHWGEREKDDQKMITQGGNLSKYNIEIEPVKESFVLPKSRKGKYMPPRSGTVRSVSPPSSPEFLRKLLLSADEKRSDEAKGKKHVRYSKEAENTDQEYQSDDNLDGQRPAISRRKRTGSRRRRQLLTNKSFQKNEPIDSDTKQHSRQRNRKVIFNDTLDSFPRQRNATKSNRDDIEDDERSFFITSGVQDIQSQEEEEFSKDQYNQLGEIEGGDMDIIGHIERLCRGSPTSRGNAMSKFRWQARTEILQKKYNVYDHNEKSFPFPREQRFPDPFDFIQKQRSPSPELIRFQTPDISGANDITGNQTDTFVIKGCPSPTRVHKSTRFIPDASLHQHNPSDDPLQFSHDDPSEHKEPLNSRYAPLENERNYDANQLEGSTNGTESIVKIPSIPMKMPENEHSDGEEKYNTRIDELRDLQQATAQKESKAARMKKTNSHLKTSRRTSRKQKEDELSESDFD